MKVHMYSAHSQRMGHSASAIIFSGQHDKQYISLIYDLYL